MYLLSPVKFILIVLPAQIAVSSLCNLNPCSTFIFKVSKRAHLFCPLGVILTMYVVSFVGVQIGVDTVSLFKKLLGNHLIE